MATPTFGSTQLTVPTTLVRLFAASFGTVTDPTLVVIRNSGANEIQLGGPELDTGNGFRMASGDALSVELHSGYTVYAIATSTASTVDILVTKGAITVASDSSEPVPGTDYSGIADAT